MNTVTILGNDTRTTGHTGGLTLVTPVRILTSVDGNWPAFLVQQLNIVHVPEPSGLLLLGGVCGGLLVLGASKARRR